MATHVMIGIPAAAQLAIPPFTLRPWLSPLVQPLRSFRSLRDPIAAIDEQRFFLGVDNRRRFRENQGKSEGFPVRTR